MTVENLNIEFILKKL